LESLVRTGHNDLVQTGCVNLWNLCLPMLQTNLRTKIRKALTTLVNILQRIERCEKEYEACRTVNYLFFSIGNNISDRFIFKYFHFEQMIYVT
jgi:hypothetical protein